MLKIHGLKLLTSHTQQKPFQIYTLLSLVWIAWTQLFIKCNYVNNEGIFHMKCPATWNFASGGAYGAILNFEKNISLVLMTFFINVTCIAY